MDFVSFLRKAGMCWTSDFKNVIFCPIEVQWIYKSHCMLTCVVFIMEFEFYLLINNFPGFWFPHEQVDAFITRTKNSFQLQM